MNKVYIFLADGFEEIEGLTVVDLLRRVDIDISMVSITGKLEVKGSHGIIVMAEQLFEDVNFDDADMLILPGGMPGTTTLMEHEGLDILLRDFNAKKKALAAICAAPSVFGMKGILEGKNATCYPGFEGKLKGAYPKDSNVVEDQNIITSRGMGTAIDFSLSLVKYFKGQEAAKKLAEEIQYKHYETL